MTIIDIREMPGYNSAVTNGVDSVSAQRVILRRGVGTDHIHDLVPFNDIIGSWSMTVPRDYPHCIRHGAMLKVSKEGIWRCGELGCDNGCFQVQ